jgi:hypothetical protein
MTASLCSLIPENFTEAEEFERFFNISEAMRIRTEWEPRETPPLNYAKKSCETNLFFGFFFDGTKNYYNNAMKGRDYSNVAHLYDCYPGQSVPGVLEKATDWKYSPS